VLGYLTAGVVIGPFGFAIFAEPDTILHVAELGVVMFLFVIGLEMEPARLWGLRRQIFGLGLLQVIVCGALLTGVGLLAGFSPVTAFIGGMGFTLTSTAVVAQILNERGDTLTPLGQRAISILLLEDLAIVPLLVVVAFLAPVGVQSPALGWPLQSAIARIASEEAGVVVILRDRESSRELMESVGSLSLPPDEIADRRGGDAVIKTYGLGAQILKDLGIQRMRVLSAPKQMHGISGFDLEITEYVDS
jgi:predicted Kef-type K+ transport protein